MSSISVYADFSAPTDEDSPVAELGDLPDDEVTDESYGAAQGAVRERRSRRRSPSAHSSFARVSSSGRTTRPAASRTGRIASRAVARCSRPAPPERPTQVIDVRDLAEWTVALCEAQTSGTYNATHPGVALSELLETCRAVTVERRATTWVTDEFLLEHEVGEWMELPLWLADPALAAADRVDVHARGRRRPRRFGPLEETVRATLAHARDGRRRRARPEREAELLAAWHDRE